MKYEIHFEWGSNNKPSSNLDERPQDYKGEYYVVLRINEAEKGHELLRPIIPYVAPAEEWRAPSILDWLGIAFIHQGLKALDLVQRW